MRKILSDQLYVETLSYYLMANQGPTLKPLQHPISIKVTDTRSKYDSSWRSLLTLCDNCMVKSVRILFAYDGQWCGTVYQCDAWANLLGINLSINYFSTQLLTMQEFALLYRTTALEWQQGMRIIIHSSGCWYWHKTISFVAIATHDQAYRIWKTQS